MLHQSLRTTVTWGSYVRKWSLRMLVSLDTCSGDTKRTDVVSNCRQFRASCLHSPTVHNYYVVVNSIT